MRAWVNGRHQPRHLVKMDDVHTRPPEDLAHYPLQQFISLDLSPSSSAQWRI
jgi:hypothetical protein